MPDETTDPYLVAAEAYAASVAADWGGLPQAYEIVGRSLDRHLRAAVDTVRPLFEAAGRTAGYESGRHVGYEEGHNDGHREGMDAGREAAAQALNAAGEADGWLAPSWAEVVEIARGDR